MTFAQIFWVAVVFLIATSMLPSNAKFRHYFFPVVFGTACFYAMREPTYGYALSWVDFIIVSALFLGHGVKTYTELKKP